MHADTNQLSWFDTPTEPTEPTEPIEPPKQTAYSPAGPRVVERPALNNLGIFDETNRLTEGLSQIYDPILVKDPDRRVAIDQTFAIHHIGQKKWAIISRNIDSNRDLWATLYTIGKGETIVIASSSQTICGEELYLTLRPKLIEHKIVKSSQNQTQTSVQTKTKPKAPPLKKADIIRQENTIKKLKIEIDPLLQKIPTEPVMRIVPGLFNSKFGELVLIKMMINCRNLLARYSMIKGKLSESNAKLDKLMPDFENLSGTISELIIGYTKYLAEKKGGVANIAPTCQSDLADWVDSAKQVIQFDIGKIMAHKPDLLFKTSYDHMLQISPIDLYPSQKDLLDFIQSNHKYLALVHTMLGSGKTTTVLPMVGWIHTIKQMGLPESFPKLLFCCPNEIVLLEVAHMAYGMAIPFAIVIYNHHKQRLEYKWSTFVDNPEAKQTRSAKDSDDIQLVSRKKYVSEETMVKMDSIRHASTTLYICDIFVCRLLLEQRRQMMNDKLLVPNYILICDEPTREADQPVNFRSDSKYSITTETFVDMMKLAPDKIILMSATLPTKDQLQEFYETVQKKHPGMIIKSFAASEAKIGCALISASGHLYSPHTGSKTVSEIQAILSVIKSNPFVGRFYSFKVLVQMIRQFDRCNFPIPDLRTLMTDPTKATQTNIQLWATEMLQTVATDSDEMVTNVCAQDEKPLVQPLNLTTVLTTDISIFRHSCLVFSSDPVETAVQIYGANFGSDILTQIKFQKILSDYEDQMKAYAEALGRFDSKRNDSIRTQNKATGKKNQAQASWQQKSKLADQEKPSWNFPLELQLGSTEFLDKYQIIHPPIFGSTIQPADLPSDSNVGSDILVLLASGIGIYAQGHPQLDDSYLQAVIHLAQQDRLKFIFADSSIAYGTNLAVSDIIVMDQNLDADKPSIIDLHSMKTIFQMLGRAGRGGNLSYVANIYTISPTNALINKINQYVRGTLDEGLHDEIRNIQEAFQEIWQTDSN